MHSFAAMGLITIQWALIGYTLEFVMIRRIVGGARLRVPEQRRRRGEGLDPAPLVHGLPGMFA